MGLGVGGEWAIGHSSLAEPRPRSRPASRGVALAALSASSPHAPRVYPRKQGAGRTHHLVLGSWPLEIIFHHGASGLFAREKLLARPHFFQETRIYEPRRDHAMWQGDAPHRVASVKGDDKLTALDEVLEKTAFFAAIEQRLAETGKTRETLRIIIKPNLMFMYSEQDRSTFTDPELVEHLVDRLREAGYRDIKVVEAQSAYGNYFYDREVPNVARLAGYDPKGRYEIVDLTAEKVPHRFRGPLGDHVVGPTWRDADFRISFAKNKTHTWAFYTLTLKNIYGALAMQDKIPRGQGA